MMKRSLRNTTDRYIQIVSCILLSAAVIFIISRIFAVLLISSDDIAFQNIMSGGYTGEPDGHAYFLSYPLSAFIAFLYRVIPGAHWYEWFLVGCLFFCTFLILSRIINIKDLRRKIIYAVSVIAAVFASFLVYFIDLEWNSVAGILGATAIFYFMSGDIKGDTKISIFELAITAFLFILCFLIRKRICYMFMPLLVFCVIYRVSGSFSGIKKEKDSLKEAIVQNKKYIYYLCGLALTLIILLVAHKIAYSSESWSEYKKYNADRSIMVDYYGYPDYDTYEEEYARAGISSQTYTLMVKDYDYIIPFHGAETIDFSELADIAEETNSETIGEKVNSAFTLIKKVFLTERIFSVHVLTIIVLTIAAVLFCRKSSPRKALFTIGTMGWGFLLFLYLGLSGRLPYRVAVPIEMGMTAGLGGLLFRRFFRLSFVNKTDTKYLSSGFMYVCMMIAASLLIVTAIASNISANLEFNEKDALLAERRAGITAYCKEHSENIYLRDFGSYSQDSKFFQHYDEYACTNYISTGGWTFNSPLCREMLANNNTTDIVDLMLEKGNVYYLVNTSRTKIVSDHLNAYFEAEKIPITVSVADSFEVMEQKVNVLGFTVSNK